MENKSFCWVLAIPAFLLIVSTGMVSADGLTPKEQLGKKIFFDKISNPDWVSCATCHAPAAGWTGSVAGINAHGAVYRGAVPTRFGNRKPPSAAYATFSPIFRYDETEGLFIGGNFWDGRATGEYLGNPAADQALGPFLNPLEQNNPDAAAVLAQIASAQYAGLWEEVWGEPISLEEADINENYDLVGLAIAAYEASSEVNQFSSQYDAYLAGEAELSEIEAEGLILFNGQGNCAACHPSGPMPDGEPPLFTDYTFDNLGLPRNPENPFYEMDSFNPLGKDWIDEGLGGFLGTRPEWETMAEENMGKHKVPTLRNVAKGDFPKAYGHNGYFKSLKSIVHFYNTRDVMGYCPDPFTLEKDALQMNCWPTPEVSVNVNTDELGDLGLTDAEENAIVAFLETLSDGYTVKKNK